MRGYPKHLNTRADYEYVRRNFDRSFWEKDFLNLLNTTHEWYKTGVLLPEDIGIEDETHQVVKDLNDDGTETGISYQLELKLNPKARIFQLGYTIEEVENILTSN